MSAAGMPQLTATEYSEHERAEVVRELKTINTIYQVLAPFDTEARDRIIGALCTLLDIRPSQFARREGQ